MTEPVLHLGDCLEVLRELDPDSVEACVTDPPYGFGDGKTAGFMGKEWDRDVPGADLWREVYRVLKPGAHLLSFFGTRTYHRGVCAIEDAGFEIRDQVQWIYGSGFPKSLDVSKAIDSAAGAEREVVGSKRGVRGADGTGHESAMPGKATGVQQIGIDLDITAPATDAAKQWDGWGTALKPASEPIVVARKPLSGTVAQTILEHGCGGLNIDAARIPHDGTGTWGAKNTGDTRGVYGSFADEAGLPSSTRNSLGRWPANIIHDGSDEVLAEFAKYGERTSPATYTRSVAAEGSWLHRKEGGTQQLGHGDTGTAARFFYCAKSSAAEREEGLEWLEPRVINTETPPGTLGANSPRAGAGRSGARRNHHPTVKPIDLMRYLCRLVTPPGGTVLDPFAGSGSTLIAAYREGFASIGIERDKDYFDMATERVKNATAQMRLAL